jgi:bla regulator protein BlaR1
MPNLPTHPLHAALPLVELSLAASVAVVMIGLLRLPVRRAFGARAAYWLWMMVPASALAVLLPVRSHLLHITVQPSPSTVAEVVLSHAFALPDAAAAIAAAPDAAASDPGVRQRAMLDRAVFGFASIGWALWGLGAIAMLALTARRQRLFERSLGPLVPLGNGAYRSGAVAEPMLVGAWRPRIVLPADFESRYTPEECALVLAHERAHMQRGDAIHNALASVWLCLSWFNPLMYWAVACFRFDQELACDAFVLTATGTGRRRYASALLKAQLASDSPALVPVGCHWLSRHPLTERIATLKRAPPGAARRSVGVLSALGLAAFGSYAVWAVQPAPTLDTPCPFARARALAANAVRLSATAASVGITANASAGAAMREPADPATRAPALSMNTAPAISLEVGTDAPVAPPAKRPTRKCHGSKQHQTGVS